MTLCNYPAVFLYGSKAKCQGFTETDLRFPHPYVQINEICESKFVTIFFSLNIFGCSKSRSLLHGSFEHQKPILVEEISTDFRLRARILLELQIGKAKSMNLYYAEWVNHSPLTVSSVSFIVRIYESIYKYSLL